MKPLAMISISVAGLMGLSAFALAAVGVHVKPLEPAIATGIGIVAGILGALPLLLNRRNDLIGVLQMAMAGTVLHLMVALGLGIALIATHKVDSHGAFLFWLLGGYWMSLISLIWQLRKLIVSATTLAQMQESKP